MLRSQHAVRFVGLTILFIGLLGLFSALTLAAQQRAGWALGSALCGIALGLGGLRLLSRGTD